MITAAIFLNGLRRQPPDALKCIRRAPRGATGLNPTRTGFLSLRYLEACASANAGPARGGWNPEDILGFIFVGIFGIGSSVFGLSRNELGVVLFEDVGDVFKEDESEDNMLVLRCVHVAAEFVGSEPKLGLKTDVGRVVGR
jgi:hypothetical protein